MERCMGPWREFVALGETFGTFDEGWKPVAKVYRTLEGCVALGTAFRTLDKGWGTVGKVYGTLDDAFGTLDDGRKLFEKVYGTLEGERGPRRCIRDTWRWAETH